MRSGRTRRYVSFIIYGFGHTLDLKNVNAYVYAFPLLFFFFTFLFLFYLYIEVFLLSQCVDSSSSRSVF